MKVILYRCPCMYRTNKAEVLTISLFHATDVFHTQKIKNKNMSVKGFQVGCNSIPNILNKSKLDV